MKRIFIQVLPLLFMLFNGTGWAFDINFKACLFSCTDHAFHIHDTDFDLNAFFKGVIIETVRITPLHETEADVIIGQVYYASLEGLFPRSTF